MRENKFRVWDKDSNSYLKNQSGLVIFNPNDTYEFDQYMKGVASPKCLAIKQFSFEQFTNDYDEKRTQEYPKGQQICEGDIIDNLWKDEHQILVCKWYDNGLVFVDRFYRTRFLSYALVIGNIHDNPELLKGDK